MKYLVTGGTGFIGRAIVIDLLEQGHEVVVFDNNFRGKEKILPSTERIKIIVGDIRDTGAVHAAAFDVESIIHLAFINGTRYFYENPELVVDVGIRGMLNIADAAKNHEIKEIILVSSSETYQTPLTIPTPENVPLVIPDILNPRYSYGGAKIASELILVDYCSRFLENWRIVRPHNIYGPNMGEEHVIPALIKKIESNHDFLEIQGDGKQIRSFCFIDDFISAFRIIMSDSRKNQIYHLGTNEEVTILELAQSLLGLMDKKLDIKFGKANDGETLRRCPDISKILEMGFMPRHQLKAGLQKTISPYKV
jgi:UDP-glucose 4-epimerase